MAKAPYKLLSVIVCDDVRTEVTKKEILIGVYSDGIVVPKLPAVLTSLFFRIHLALQIQEQTTFSFQVLKPSGQSLLDTNDQTLESRRNVILAMGIQGPNLDEAGKYQMFLRVGNRRRQMIGEFNVTEGPVTSP